LTVAGLAGHVIFELGAGVGMPLASVLGPYGAAGVWTLAAGGVWRAAGARHRSADKMLAAVNGFGVAAVAAHLVGWPTRPTRTGLPWLAECEGLGPELMPFYNPILYCSAATALLAIARERRTAPVRLPMAMLGLVPVLVAFQHWEHRRLLRQAHTRPGWSTRRLRRLAATPWPANRRGRPFLLPLGISHLGIGLSMVISAVVCAVGLAVTCAWAPETTAKNLTEAGIRPEPLLVEAGGSAAVAASFSRGSSSESIHMSR
jgi:hypothetical protein